MLSDIKQVSSNVCEISNCIGMKADRDSNDFAISHVLLSIPLFTVGRSFLIVFSSNRFIFFVKIMCNTKYLCNFVFTNHMTIFY